MAGEKLTDALCAEAQCRVLEGALRVGIEALSGHACHIGPSCPCIRSADQCAAECGREAGDALLALRQALSLSGGGGREEKGSLPTTHRRCPIGRRS